MKKIVFLIVLLLTLAACAQSDPTPTNTPSPTQTPLPTPLPVPTQPIATPTQPPEIIAPTNEPASLLSAEGPWLMYLYNTPRRGECCGGRAPIYEKFVLLNQDGSGRTSIPRAEGETRVSDFLMTSANSANHLVAFEDGL